MQYLLMIYNCEKDWMAMTEAQRKAASGDYAALTQQLKDAGQFRAGEALKGATTAVTVRVRGGVVQTTDGPFAEARESIGGFYLVEAQDLDEATKIAARIPDAAIGGGGVEIRPIMTFG